ncbi:uncharacterized protein ASCRUDRAFT_129989 [Ascoidea rubescens DSM 1968]|uniref:Uncharacterized protein n=1 Tax=Ascoidea rubescens DSM 1968 TaxID=1344418 RepID=A0A1D2V8K4_9ASCO|nr:hypothetical protein ASCRUDRAFT_129989 [Ascoidea rubescens DSM 1968]ODV57982.1 hypothetical protein ASCRUDRAFT_129989 [Ascoidea rubescens DSM 1968]
MGGPPASGLINLIAIAQLDICHAVRADNNATSDPVVNDPSTLNSEAPDVAIPSYAQNINGVPWI